MYGKENIGVFVFSCDSEQTALSDERLHIERLRAEGYNLANATIGGEGVTGLRHTAESKEKMAAAKRGKRLSEAHRAALSASLRGRPDLHKPGRTHSEETKRLMSETRSGRPGKPHSDESRIAMSIAHLGKAATNKGMPSPMRGVPRTSEVRAKISAAHKGKTLSDEHRKKLSELKKGKFPTPEHRAKVSAGLRAFHRNLKQTAHADGENNGQ